MGIKKDIQESLELLVKQQGWNKDTLKLLMDATNKVEESPTKAIEVLSSLEGMIQKRIESYSKSILINRENDLELKYKEKEIKLENNYKKIEKELEDKYKKEITDLKTYKDSLYKELCETQNKLVDTMTFNNEQVKQGVIELITEMSNVSTTRNKVDLYLNGKYFGKTAINVPSQAVIDAFIQICKSRGEI